MLSADVVKVVTDARGRALYFSRSPVPFPRDAVRRYGSLAAALEAEPALLQTFRKHTGLYVYRRELFVRIHALAASALERAESLEQLRALERGAVITVVEADSPSIGVDTEQDLRARERDFDRGCRMSDLDDHRILMKDFIGLGFVLLLVFGGLYLLTRPGSL